MRRPFKKGALLTALRSRYIRSMVSALSSHPPLLVYWKYIPKLKARMSAPMVHAAHLALEFTAGASGTCRLEGLHVDPC